MEHAAHERDARDVPAADGLDEGLVPRNMYSMQVTLETSQSPMACSKAAAPLSLQFTFLKLESSQPPMGWLKDAETENMLPISMALDASQSLMGWSKAAAV